MENIQFGVESYWNNHGIFFLIFITFFPRLTLIFSSVASGGILWWLGFFFAPRILVSFLATLAYWNENPILVLISWMIALGGESSEKYYVTKKTVFRTNPKKNYVDSKEVFEAEFERKDPQE